MVEHYERPRNVGAFDKNDANVGTGLVGAPACGDVMKLQVRVCCMRSWRALNPLRHHEVARGLPSSADICGYGAGHRVLYIQHIMHLLCGDELIAD